MAERDIAESDVTQTIRSGEIIEDYPEDTPYPSSLRMGISNGKPIHVVSAWNPLDSTAIVITVYQPDPARWDPTFKRRIQK